MTRRRWIALLLLAALPLALRLPAVGHGLPHNYVPDTHIVRSALGMARDVDPVPPVMKYSSYPNLLPYCLLPIYATQYAVGRLAGEWGGAAEFGHVLQREPERAHLPARVLVALMGTLTPWVVFRAARAAGLRAGAWVSAWLVATGLLHVHFSVQERPWVPMVLFLALSLWPAALYAADGRRRWLVLSGAAAGLAFATHQAGLTALGVPGVAWLFRGGWRGPELRRRLADGCACVGLFALVSVVVGHPYWLRHGFSPPGEFAGAEAFEDDGSATLTIAGQTLKLSVSWQSVTRLSRSFLGYDPVLVVLGLAGLAAALRRPRTRPATLFAVLWGAFFLTNQNDHVRYLLPLGVLLAVPAGVAGEWLARRRVGLALLAVLLAVPLVQSLRLGWLLRQPDTRVEGAEVLHRLGEGHRVAIDRYGPIVELDRQSLERIAGWRDLGFRERGRLELLRATETEPELARELGVVPGLDALRAEDFLRFDERADRVWLAPGRESLGATPAEALRALGATHVLLVSRKPAGGGPALLARLVEGRDALASVSPSSGGAPPREAYLPIEMRFPLTGLWEVDRPGPWMALYPLE